MPGNPLPEQAFECREIQLTVRELLAMPREKRLALLRESAAEAQAMYANDDECSDWAELGIEDLYD